VLEARAPGVSVRRAAQIGQVSPSPVKDWTQQAWPATETTGDHAAPATPPREESA
jgi:hypothetical protein